MGGRQKTTLFHTKESAARELEQSASSSKEKAREKAKKEPKQKGK
ncbi:MAG: hypothetical protein QXS85_04000 [Acidilobaceae archaeon]